MYLDLLLAFCSKTADLQQQLALRTSFNRQICEDFNRQLLPLFNRNTSHSFSFRGYQSYQSLRTYQEKKQAPIDNFTVLIQVTISIDIQYNLWTDQPAYSIDCCTGLYTYWSKQQMSIDSFTYLWSKNRQVSIENSIHICHSKYRSTISRAYWSQ